MVLKSLNNAGKLVSFGFIRLNIIQNLKLTIRRQNLRSLFGDSIFVRQYLWKVVALKDCGLALQ